MAGPEIHTGTVYGHPVRFVRAPIPDDTPRHRRKHAEQNPRVLVVLDDLIAALDLRPAVATVMRDALALWCCGWEPVRIGRRSLDAPTAELTRPMVESAYRSGHVGRRALADYDRALGAAVSTLAYSAKPRGGR